jgi:DNA-binding SARP family transcriptional activator/TolB-like protein
MDSSRPKPLIDLRLLGRFAALSLKAQEFTVRDGSARLRAIVSYLAMRPDYRETRERLAALLWGDHDAKTARQNLRQALLGLRREFAVAGRDLVLISQDLVALDPAAWLIDAREFEKLAWSESPQDTARAVGLYGGNFLDPPVFSSPGLDEWITSERERLRGLALSVFEKHALASSTNGFDAAQAVQRLVACDPFDEPAQRLLLRTLAARLSRRAALAQAANFAKLLRKELDSEPAPATAALVAAIENGSLEARAPRAGDHVSAASGAAKPSLDATPANGDRDAQQISRPHAIVDGKALESEGIYSVLVLPLETEDTSKDSNERRIAQALADDLIGDLSRVTDLRVISRVASNALAGRRIDVVDIGAQFGVHYVVEGKLRMVGRVIYFDLGLIDVSTRLRVGSERLDCTLEKFAKFRDEVTRGLAYRIFTRILIHKGEHASRRGSYPGLGDLIAKGWAAQTKVGMTGLGLQAGDYFKQALEIDPNNVAALVGLSAYKIMRVITFTSDTPDTLLDDAEPLLHKALARNPYASRPYHYLGLLEKARRRPMEALAAIGRAVELDPSFAPAYGAAANILARMGRTTDGLKHALYAIQLGPRDPSVGIWHLFAGEIELELGNDQQALKWLKESVMLNPQGPFGLAALAALHRLRGESDAAFRVADRMSAYAPWLTVDGMIDRLVGSSQGGHEPRRLLKGLEKTFG